MPTKRDLVDTARKTGDARARAAVRRRSTAIAKRTQAVAAAPRAKTAAAQPAVPAKFILAAGPAASAGVVIAEGDSWFDYPGADVLSLLEDEHGFDVEGVAHAGDRVEAMAYQDGQLDDFCRVIEKVLRTGRTPVAVLLSGGGNDIAGAEFEMLLDHASSPVPGLNTKVLEGVIAQRIYFSYVTVIQAVTRLCVEKIGRPLPIVLHGYDYPVPDGRGFGWGWIPGLPGPWLEPGFRTKGYAQMSARLQYAKEMIDAFNDMLASLTRVSGFHHVRYVDLRGTLSTHPGSYKRWWANELHPTPVGFSAVTARIAQAITSRGRPAAKSRKSSGRKRGGSR